MRSATGMAKSTPGFPCIPFWFQHWRMSRCTPISIVQFAVMLMPMKKEESVAFFNLINAMHEKASVIITTNKAPTE